MAKAPKAAEAATEVPAAPTEDTAPKAPKAPKIEREKQNGQTKPAEGTKTRALWDIIDQISADTGAPATRKAVMEAAEAQGFNLAMSASLYSHWRKFHGLVGSAAPGRTAKPAEEAAPPTPPAPDVPPAPPVPDAPTEEAGE